MLALRGLLTPSVATVRRLVAHTGNSCCSTLKMSMWSMSGPYSRILCSPGSTVSHFYCPRRMRTGD
ncbi:unnamed protein product [Effrenium voratum]|nr:unnamed protein product [Effrenium voratum]CAJ1432834.1 unnamed protein product [Effrenium voratum]